VVVAVALLAAALIPGVLAAPEADERRGHLRIAESTIATGTVTGRTATISTTAYIQHRGGRSGNVSVLFRATDLDTGLVTTTTTRTVGEVAGDREVPVVGNLSVERDGGYRLETVVYRDGERVAEASREVRGVGTLQPAYARNDVEFHRFGGVGFPSVEYTVSDADGERADIDVTAFLTNTGDDTAGDLRLEVKARQVDSNIVADRAETSVDGVRPGRTVAPGVTLTVPEGYNYYLDATLWSDDVIVATARSTATLDPSETVPENTTRRDVGLEVSDFTDEDDREPREPEPTPAEAEASRGDSPGFGVGVALVALLGSALLARRWSA